MINGEIEIRVDRNYLTADGLSFAILKRENGKRYYASLVFVEATEEFIVPELNHIAERSSQSLMDGLYAAGLRPTEGKSSIGKEEAMSHHLSDMRKIAFNKLKIKE